MAQSKPRRDCFPGCFGLPGTRRNKYTGIARSGSRKDSRWFSWLRARMNKSATKTVPLNLTKSDKTDARNGMQTSKPHKRLTPIAAGNKSGPISTVPPAAGSDRHPIEKRRKVWSLNCLSYWELKEFRFDLIQSSVYFSNRFIFNGTFLFQTRYGTTQNSSLEDANLFADVDSPKNTTCQKRLSFHRKLEDKRTVPSLPNSADSKHRSGPLIAVSRPIAGVSQSAASSPKKRNKRDQSSRGQSKYDPIVGMSIIMVTLIIMLIWGRLCAILCTSACFYFIPRLSAASQSQNGNERSTEHSFLNSGDPESVDSKQYKKRVVLEGLLQRSHHATLGSS